MTLEVWQFILTIVGVIIISAIITFIITRKLFARQLQKNPPITESMIRAMMTQMGRTPSEKQVRAVMRSMEDEKTKEERNKKAAKAAKK